MTQDKYPDNVYVIIPTAGERPDLLKATLQSLVEIDGSSRLNAVHVVENGGDSKGRDLCDHFSTFLPMEYTHVRAAGKSNALNIVLQKLKRGLAIFFDDDVRIGRKTIATYVNFAQQEGGLYFYGGPTGVDYESRPPDWLRRALPLSARGYELKTSELIQIVRRPCFLGFNWAAHIEDILEAGGFDTKRGPGAKTNAVGQEQEMQNRLVARGLRGAYLSEAKVYHFVPIDRCSEEWLVERGFRSGRSRRLEAEGKGRWAVVTTIADRLIKQAVFELAARSGSRHWKVKAKKERRAIQGLLCRSDTSSATDCQ